VPIADLGSIACFVDTLDFDLAVHPSTISAEGLKKKAIAISRSGSVFDVAARELLGGLGAAATNPASTLRSTTSLTTASCAR
jgi:hypothetical protein